MWSRDHPWTPEIDCKDKIGNMSSKMDKSINLRAGLSEKWKNKQIWKNLRQDKKRKQEKSNTKYRNNRFKCHRKYIHSILREIWKSKIKGGCINFLNELKNDLKTVWEIMKEIKMVINEIFSKTNLSHTFLWKKYIFMKTSKHT